MKDCGDVMSAAGEWLTFGHIAVCRRILVDVPYRMLIQSSRCEVMKAISILSISAFEKERRGVGKAHH